MPLSPTFHLICLSFIMAGYRSSLLNLWPFQHYHLLMQVQAVRGTLVDEAVGEVVHNWIAYVVYILCVFFAQTDSIVVCYNICVINYIKPLLRSSFWYWSHIFLAISSLLTFACSFSALLGNLHTSPPVASSFWYNISPILSGGDISLILSELYIQMKLWIAARAGGRWAWTAMSVYKNMKLLLQNPKNVFYDVACASVTKIE